MLDDNALKISIHALREEGDPPVRGTAQPPLQISIHALREEGDLALSSGAAGEGKFLSTPSARRATRPVRCPEKPGGYFYPRPPRGGRHANIIDIKFTEEISIHALREEGDNAGAVVPAFLLYFYPRPPRGGRLPRVPMSADRPRFLSTPSARRATAREMTARERFTNFYPRPPRGGRPRRPRCTSSGSRHFYPRPPRGGRHRSELDVFSVVIFLSTPSARRATPEPRIGFAVTSDFYPRPPRGGRHPRHQAVFRRQRISIHALREEGDSKNRDKISIFKQIIQHSARI